MQQPRDIKVKIWRYMSLEKLIDFLRTDELYFARGNILIDEFEGIGTRMNALGREWLARISHKETKAGQLIEERVQ